MSKVVVMDHPLIEQKIGIIRRKETGTKDFRQNIRKTCKIRNRIRNTSSFVCKYWRCIKNRYKNMRIHGKSLRKVI